MACEKILIRKTAIILLQLTMLSLYEHYFSNEN